MQSEQGIIVYTKDDPYEKIVIQAYQDVCRRGLTNAETKGFVESVLSYDGLFENFLKNPYSVSSDVFSAKFTGHVCIVCYPIELRQVLRSKTLVSNYKIAGLPYETAKRMLSEYPVILVIDQKKLKSEPFAKLNGVYLFESEFHFGESLVRVIARDTPDSDITEVLSMVNEESPGVDFGVVTDAPGLAPAKVAQTMAPQKPQPTLNKYIVNVPNLGIEDEVIKNHSDVAALQEALNRKWQQSGNPHKEPKYTADYWLNSPIIQSNPQMRSEIVREAETATYIVKESGTDMLSPEEIDELRQDLKNSHAALKGRFVHLRPVKKEAAVKLQLPIQVEQDEQEIFDLLLSVNQKFNLGLTFRVAGGWVRDRLLGVQSKDIDIALDKMTGGEFCKYITKMTGKHPAIIAADAAKSKSLETATINLFGRNVDFTQLRK